MDYHIVIKPPPEKIPGADESVWIERQRNFNQRLAELQHAFCTIDYSPIRQEDRDSMMLGNPARELMLQVQMGFAPPAETGSSRHAHAISDFGFEQFNQVPDAVCVILQRQLDLPKDAKIYLLSISPTKPFAGVVLGRLKSIAEKFGDIILKIDPPFETILQCRQKIPAAERPARSAPTPIRRGVPQDGPLPMTVFDRGKTPDPAPARVKATRIVTGRVI